MRISDWSSDVCSSDLAVDAVAVEVHADGLGATGPVTVDHRVSVEVQPDDVVEPVAALPVVQGAVGHPHGAPGEEALRSEERRVGKECVSTCRSRWSAYNYKTTHTHTQRRTIKI